MKKTLLLFACFLVFVSAVIGVIETSRKAVDNKNEITEVPVIRIATKDPHEIINREAFVDAFISLSSGDVPDNTPIKIKGRGNSTWGNRKNPMIFTFDGDVSVMNMKPAKKWLLIANYADKTLMRNYLASEFAASYSHVFVPKNISCEVYYNKTYLGVYGLSEKVELADGRINDCDNGILLEIDGAYSGEDMFKTGVMPSPVVFAQFKGNKPSNSVKSEVELEIKYIESLIVEKNPRVFKYIDADSFADWFIANDFFKNCDSAFYSSCFLYKNKNKKYVMGPVWDFDVSLGNTSFRDCDNPEGDIVATAGWYKYLMEMSEFRSLVCDRWTQLRDDGNVDAIFENIEKMKALLGDSVGRNYKTWDTLSLYCWPNVRVNGSYDSELEYIKEFLIRRIIWYDGQYYTGDREKLTVSTDKLLADCLPLKINSYNREWAGQALDYLNSRGAGAEKCRLVKAAIDSYDKRPPCPVITYPSDENVLELENGKVTLKWELPDGYGTSFVTVSDTTDRKKLFEREPAGTQIEFDVTNGHRYDFKVEIKLPDGEYSANDTDKLHSFAAFVLPERFSITDVRRIGNSAVISWNPSPSAKYYTIGVVNNKTSEITVNVEYVEPEKHEYAFEISAADADYSVYVMAHADDYSDVYRVYRLAENSNYQFKE